MPVAETTDKIIARLSRSGASYGKQKLRVIENKNVRRLAEQRKIPLRAAEILCLSQKVIPLRYLRNIGTLGIEGQLKLRCASVAVCGAGGLGGTAIELLARAGVGHLIIIDYDIFSESNLNRQIMSTEADLGKAKSRVTAARVKKINAAVQVSAVCQKINARNIKKIIRDAQVVIDGLDNGSTRLVVARACGELGIPLVHAAVAGWCGQLLSVFPGDERLKIICGDRSVKNRRGIESMVGTPSATPAALAAWQAQEAIKIITGIGLPVRERILFLDFSAGHIDEIEFK